LASLVWLVTVRVRVRVRWKFTCKTLIQLLGGSNFKAEDRRFCDLGSLWCPKKPDHINIDLQIPHHGFGILHNLMEGPRANADHGMAVLVEPLVN
jgi:hypothetical protein